MTYLVTEVENIFWIEVILIKEITRIEKSGMIDDIVSRMLRTLWKLTVSKQLQKQIRSNSRNF